MMVIMMMMMLIWDCFILIGTFWLHLPIPITKIAVSIPTAWCRNYHITNSIAWYFTGGYCIWCCVGWSNFIRLPKSQGGKCVSHHLCHYQLICDKCDAIKKQQYSRSSREFGPIYGLPGLQSVRDFGFFPHCYIHTEGIKTLLLWYSLMALLSSPKK